MKKKSNSKQPLIPKKDYIKLLPIGLILAIVPLIVFLRTNNLDDFMAKAWKGSKQDVDFFTYYKTVWFMALTSISFIFYLFYIGTKKIKFGFSKIFIPLAGYIFFVFLSSSFSEYHSVAFEGFPERYEGFFTILCYALICYIGANLITTKFDYKYLVVFLTISVTIISLIGIFQFLGYDLFQSNFGQKLILPKANENIAGSLDFRFPEKYIYSTLYNPNYVGGLFGMILPVSLIAFLSSRKPIMKLISGIFCCLSFATLIGSLSSAGWISAAFSSIVLIIFLRKELKRNIIPLITIVVCFGLITFLLNYSSQGKVFNELNISSNLTSNIKNSISSFISPVTSKSNFAFDNADYSTAESGIKNINFDGTVGFQNLDLKSSEHKNISASKISTSSSQTNITDIKVENNRIYIYTSDTDALVITIEGSSSSNTITFVDLDNKEVSMSSKEIDGKNVILFTDNRYKDIQIFIQNVYITIQAPNTSFTLTNTDKGLNFITPSGMFTGIVKAESFGFDGKEKWASNRGYIWSRSIPMLKDTILLGHGPDTFSIYFPQDDYAAKMKYLDSGIYTIVDKPHNLYLQIGINTGIISLIFFLIFMGWYCLWSIKLFIKGINNNEFFVPGIACFIAVISFLISSLANDSTISVSPIFWIILGTGIACNRQYFTKKALEIYATKK